MAEYQAICRLLVSISVEALENYNPNSYIVEGAFQLSKLISDSPFPEETCYWIAKSILSDNRSWMEYMYTIGEDLHPLFHMLFGALLRTTNNYQPEIEGISNPEFVKIITTPEAEFTTFFPGGFDIDDFDNDSHREILAQGDTSDSEDSDLEIFYDSDEDDFIDLENPPEYSRYSESLPRYEESNMDTLLDAGIPLYSEFSWIRMMLFRAESLE